MVNKNVSGLEICSCPIPFTPGVTATPDVVRIRLLTGQFIHMVPVGRIRILSIAEGYCLFIGVLYSERVLNVVATVNVKNGSMYQYCII